MMKKISVILLVSLWTVLCLGCWVLPKEELSESERRPLAQMPRLKGEAVLNGSFMEDFEKFTLDQFPLREGFRRIKSLFHYYGLGQKDNNGIYLWQGAAAQQEYPLKEDSLAHAAERFTHLYHKFLADSGSNVWFAAVPDKSYYLAEQAGQLRMDYEAMFAYLQQEMPWAQWIDLTGSLGPGDYYRTDTHWRQENLLGVAKTLCNAMGTDLPAKEQFSVTEVQRPFYGVYYGQAALSMEPDMLRYLESELLAGCSVYDYETGKQGAVYDLEKLDGKDPYEVFLSGSKSLLTIENPSAATDRELILFRDSFGSSLAPLLVQGYAKVTLVDIRYLSLDVLDRFLEFNGQDVLFLYSTLILNNSATIK